MTPKRKKPQRKLDDNPTGIDGELDIPFNTPAPMPSSTKYADKKQDEFRHASSELQFTSSLYIDQAIEALRENGRKANEGKDLLIIKTDVTKVDSDRVRFKLASERMGKTTFTIIGTMQRWEGSRTRVDAKLRDRRHSRVSATNIAVIFFAISLMLVPLLLLEIIDNPGVAVGICLVLFSVMFFMIKRLSALETRSDSLRKRTEYDNDELELIMLETFRDHDMQWLSNRRIKNYWR